MIESPDLKNCCGCETKWSCSWEIHTEGFRGSRDTTSATYSLILGGGLGYVRSR